MSSDPLPVTVIGAEGVGAFTLEGLRESPAVRIVGISSRDPAICEDLANQIQVPSFSDERRALVETRPSAVFVGLPPAEVPELINICAQHHIHVWKEPPLARNLDEAVGMVRRMERANLKLVVGTQRRFAETYRRIGELITEIGEIFLGRGHYLFNWGSDLGWRGDKGAGGGALREFGYHVIDLLIWLLGLPEEVYGISVGEMRTGGAGSNQQTQALYDSDDTTTAILRYLRGATATLITSRRAGPVSEELNLHGRRGSVTVNSETAMLRDSDGNVLDRITDQSRPVTVFRRQVDTFAQGVRTDPRFYECSGFENLLTMAVIEAIYLSDRTSQPESPLRLLHTYSLTEEDCLRFRPPASP